MNYNEQTLKDNEKNNLNNCENNLEKNFNADLSLDNQINKDLDKINSNSNDININNRFIPDTTLKKCMRASTSFLKSIQQNKLFSQ